MVENESTPLSQLVSLVTEKVTVNKDPAKPYVGLEHIPSKGSALLGVGSASDSVSTNNVFRSGDTLFGKLRPRLRKSVRVSIDGYCSTDILVLRPTDSANAKFVSFVLQSDPVFAEAIRTEEGTKMPRCSWKSLKDLNIFCPQLPQQRRIAEILSTLDETIEQTEALIAKYQQIKVGLMHDLFTRGVTPNGKLRPTRAEVPQLYKESPLGWIPKEWSFGLLSEFLVGGPKNGYSPQEVNAWSGLNALGLGCLTSDGFKPNHLKMVALGSSTCREALLEDGDLLLSRSNTRDLVGLCGIYRDVGGPCIYPDLMMRIRPNGRTSAQFLEALLLSPLLRVRVTGAAVGTSGSMVKLNSRAVLRLNLAMPEEDEQTYILRLIYTQRAALESLESNLAKLRQQKHGLMHDLLTGRVRVKVAESEAA